MGGISHKYFPRTTDQAHPPRRIKMRVHKEVRCPAQDPTPSGIVIAKATHLAVLPTVPVSKSPKTKHLPPFEWTLVTTRSDKSHLEAYKAKDLIEGWLHRRKAAGEAHFRKNINIRCAQVTFDVPECSDKAFPGIRVSGTSEYALDITVELLADLARTLLLGLEKSTLVQLDSSIASRVVRKVQQQPMHLIAAE